MMFSNNKTIQMLLLVGDNRPTVLPLNNPHPPINPPPGMLPVDQSAAAVDPGYLRNAYVSPKKNPNLSLAASAHKRHCCRFWDSSMNEPHDRHHERETKRARTVMAGPPGRHAINSIPGTIRPLFYSPMYQGAISNPSQISMQGPEQFQSQFGTAARVSLHLHPQLHAHQLPIPFHQLCSMRPPQITIQMSVGRQPLYALKQQKHPFQLDPSAIFVLC